MELTRRVFARRGEPGAGYDMPLADGDGVFAEFLPRTNRGVHPTVRRAGAGCGLPFSEGSAKDQFNQTVAFWRRLVRALLLRRPVAQMVHRSGAGVETVDVRTHSAIGGRPVRCRNALAAAATGITATSGFATRRLRFMRLSASASARRPTASWSGSRTGAARRTRTGHCS